jgi:hypothetical protein
MVKRTLPPDQRDWLDRPKGKPLEASTKAFILGIILLIVIIWFAVFSGVFIQKVIQSFVSLVQPGSLGNGGMGFVNSLQSNPVFSPMVNYVLNSSGLHYP